MLSARRRELRMWGTIARMRVRSDVAETYLLAQMDAFNKERLAGMVSVTFYRSDSDPRELWMIAMFATKEAYRKNAESRAQHVTYLTMRACLERDPEWHDVGELKSYFGGPPT